MVKPYEAQEKPQATLLFTSVVFTTHYTSLGRKKDKWCIYLPATVHSLLDKRRPVQVTLIPLVGTIGAPR